jgi:hypothetical protein
LASKVILTFTLLFGLIFTKLRAKKHSADYTI